MGIKILWGIPKPKISPFIKPPMDWQGETFNIFNIRYLQSLRRSILTIAVISDLSILFGGLKRKDDILLAPYRTYKGPVKTSVLGKGAKTSLIFHKTRGGSQKGSTWQKNTSTCYVFLKKIQVVLAKETARSDFAGRQQCKCFLLKDRRWVRQCGFLWKGQWNEIKVN